MWILYIVINRPSPTLWRDIFQALEGGSLSTDGRLLPQSFVGDCVTGNAFESNCFLTTGDDGTPGVFLGSNKLMVVKVVR